MEILPILSGLYFNKPDYKIASCRCSVREVRVAMGFYMALYNNNMPKADRFHANMDFMLMFFSE